TSAGAATGTATGTATGAPRGRGAARRIHTAVPVAEWCGGPCTEHAIALLDARVRAAADPRTGTAAVSVRAGELGSCHGRAACARCTACGGSGADRRSAGHAAVAGLRAAAGVSHDTAALFHAGASGSADCAHGAHFRAATRAGVADAAAAGPVRTPAGARAHPQRLHAHSWRRV